jgi:hypothetical protein
MSEREAERNVLIPYAANSPALVQAAGRQLGIAAQLNEDLERRRFVALLKRISAKEAIDFLSREQPLDCDLIERFKDRWNWQRLSMNEVLPWSIKIIEQFKDRLDWRHLSGNIALPWSINLIEQF